MRNLLFLVSAFLIFNACDLVRGERIKGNGSVTTENRSVGAFEGIRSSGSFDVYVSNGPASVRIEAESNLLPYIETTIENNILHIRTKEGVNLSPKRDMKLYIVAPQLASVFIDGSGDIISQSTLTHTGKMEFGISGSGNVQVTVNAPEVEAGLSGSGNINLAGQTKLFTGQIDGSGDIKALELQSEEARIDISGSGNADVYASRKVVADVNGSGDVRYKGGAQQVSSNINGSGNVKRMD